MNITRGKQARAQRVVIYGTEGIGKSTFASQFPNPLFIDTEGSTSNMDVARMDKPTSWTMLMNQIAFVKANPTVCNTLVIDTIDWAETLAIESVCAQHGKKGIEDFGYGNGYTYVREEFGRFLNKLQELVDIGINVVLTAHSQLRKFEQPDEDGAYDRYELKLGKKTSSQTAPVVKEWCDLLLFCNYKTVVMTSETKKKKAQGGKRVMYTTHHPAWDAKNRHGLPDELPMEYAAIAHIFESSKPKTVETVAPQNVGVGKVVSEPQVDEQVPSVDEVIPTGTSGAETQGDPFPLKEPINIPDSIPNSLKDLMLQNSVTTEELQAMAFSRKHFPKDTPIENFPSDYWDFIVAHWDESMQVITQNRNLFK
nr:MAG TPA: AAA domain protein [Siphoviridae sp. cte3s7]